MTPKLRSAFARLILWIIRAFCFFTLVGMIHPAAPRPLPDAGGSVQTDHPTLCVHTRLIDEVETWKIQRTLVLARELGASTIVEFFPWAYLQPAPDRYDWAPADRIVSYAREQGLHIIARLGLVPAWAQADARAAMRAQGLPDTLTLNTLPADAYANFASFAAAFAQRYAGTIDQLIIWNEPNLAFEWGYRQVSAADYAALLRAVYAPIHAANPNALVLAAPLAPTLEPEGSANGLDDLLYLRALYAAGAAPYFDALAIHTYGFTEPPETAPAPDRLNFRRAELLHDIMTRNGDADTPVYITETGWNDHPRWVNAVSPASRIAYTIEGLEWSEKQWPWARSLCLWMLRAPTYTFSYPDYFTLVTPDFELKPIYDALRGWAHNDRSGMNTWLPAPVVR